MLGGTSNSSQTKFARAPGIPRARGTRRTVVRDEVGGGLVAAGGPAGHSSSFLRSRRYSRRRRRACGWTPRATIDGVGHLPRQGRVARERRFRRRSPRAADDEGERDIRPRGGCPRRARRVRARARGACLHCRVPPLPLSRRDIARRVKRPPRHRRNPPFRRSLTVRDARRRSAPTTIYDRRIGYVQRDESSSARRSWLLDRNGEAAWRRRGRDTSAPGPPLFYSRAPPALLGFWTATEDPRARPQKSARDLANCATRVLQVRPALDARYSGCRVCRLGLVMLWDPCCGMPSDISRHPARSGPFSRSWCSASSSARLVIVRILADGIFARDNSAGQRLPRRRWIDIAALDHVSAVDPCRRLCTALAAAWIAARALQRRGRNHRGLQRGARSLERGAHASDVARISLLGARAKDSRPSPAADRRARELWWTSGALTVVSRSRLVTALLLSRGAVAGGVRRIHALRTDQREHVRPRCPSLRGLALSNDGYGELVWGGARPRGRRPARRGLPRTQVRKPSCSRGA